MALLKPVVNFLYHSSVILLAIAAIGMAYGSRGILIGVGLVFVGIYFVVHATATLMLRGLNAVLRFLTLWEYSTIEAKHVLANLLLSEAAVIKGDTNAD